MKKLIDQRGVESGYGIPTDTMDKLRARGVAPPWLKIGHKIYFRVEELEKWLDEQQDKASGKSQPGEAHPAKLDNRALDATFLNTLALDDETLARIARPDRGCRG